MHVCPQDTSCDFLHQVHQVMMIVPIDADENKAQNIGREHWPERMKVVPTIALGHLHFQNHNGENDGDHAIAESFESVLVHVFLQKKTHAAGVGFFVNESRETISVSRTECCGELCAYRISYAQPYVSRESAG